ncbi:major capsid protein [Loigolactobacillus backii]|uniref:major capsid protein n=1 Tax=Loigolactobacillus backii TaxID=375175 RepID=UPI0007F06C6D|nr:major capsid protein [Loigolactobacillus backii]ANK59819.1 hypothetical protein AYR52_05820 [Loigolactobacillus backii]
MPQSIFDMIRAQDVAVYYTTMPQTEPPFLGDELFPAKKQLGMDLAYIKGANNTQVALRPSAFDANVIPRGRQGFAEIKHSMPYYKESTYIDEEIRQKLLLVQSSNNPAYQDVIVNNIFNNVTQLVTSAQISREIVRMQALTTGYATISGNGTSYVIDFDMPASNRVAAKVAWDQAKSNPLTDIKNAKRAISYATGQTITRAVVNQTTWDALLANETIKATLLVNNANTANAMVLDPQLQSFLQSNTGIQFVVYDKGYKDVNNAFHQYIPDGVVAFLPGQSLGSTWFGTTPEEADLMGISNIANVAMVDTGVAITTMAKAEPVNVETKVSQLTLPSFEMADSVYVLSGVVTPATDDSSTTNTGATSSAASSGSAAASGASSSAPKA